MSALLPIADIVGHRSKSASCQFRKWPSSFDHLVRAAEQCRRYGEAEDFCALEVDDKLEFGRLLVSDGLQVYFAP
jgi:hypothetical protein